MLYYPDHKLAFLHIPKTGGTSVKEFMKKQFGHEGIWLEKNLFHEPLRTKRDLMKPYFNKTKILATIRHPYEQVISSYYLYKNIIDKTTPFEEFLEWLIHPNKRFEEWFKNPQGKNKLTGYFRNYADWFLIDGIFPPNVTILKLEALNIHTQSAFKWQRRDIKIEHLNPTKYKPKDTTHYLTNENKAKIQKYFKWTFEDKRWYEP